MVKRLVNNFLYPDLTYKIRGCAFRVYNELGYGHKETVYQKALTIEFDAANIIFEKEKALPVIYKGIKTGVYRPDFLLEGKLIVEIKSLSYLPKDYIEQVINYLKGTEYKLALIINFGASRIDIRRILWDPNFREQNRCKSVFKSSV